MKYLQIYSFNINILPEKVITELDDNYLIDESAGTVVLLNWEDEDYLPELKNYLEKLNILDDVIVVMN